MGSDLASFMTNFFLCYNENKWVRKIKTKDYLNRAKQLVTVFRFTDDFTAIYDGGEFEDSLNEMHPPELEL